MLFSLYGLIVGIAIAVGLWLVEKRADQEKISSTHVESVGTWAVVGGLIGARVWHVITNFVFYAHDLIQILKVWNGGLSILGAIAGGVLGVMLAVRISKYQISAKQMLDLSVFGLPFGQAIGRLGNFVNQELYGWPTDLPWGMYIKPENRLPQFAPYEFFHPLFAYEMIATGTFGIWIWWFASKLKWQIGSGDFFALYILYYAVVRSMLDLLRPDKALIANTTIGINQLVLVTVALVVVAWLVYKRRYE